MTRPKKILGKPTDKVSKCPKCGAPIEILHPEFTGETIFYCPKCELNLFTITHTLKPS